MATGSGMGGEQEQPYGTVIGLKLVTSSEAYLPRRIRRQTFPNQPRPRAASSRGSPNLRNEPPSPRYTSAFTRSDPAARRAVMYITRIPIKVERTPRRGTGVGSLNTRRARLRLSS